MATDADNDSEQRVREAVDEIGRHAREVNLGRVARLAPLLRAAADGGIDESQRLLAIELTHQLIGSAGMFGSAGAGELAASLERFFADGAPDDPDRLATASRQLRRLRRELTGDSR